MYRALCIICFNLPVEDYFILFDSTIALKSVHFLSLYAFKSLFYGVAVSPTVIFRTPRIIGRQITSKKITGYYNSVASPGSEAVLSLNI